MTPLPRWMSYGRVFLCIPIAFLLPTVVSILSTGLGPTQLGVASSFLIWGAIWCWVWLRAVGRDHTAQTERVIRLRDGRVLSDETAALEAIAS